MSNLIKYKFSDLYEMGSGISTSKEQAGHGYPFASFSTVISNYFLPGTLTDLMDTTEEQREVSSILEGDILITRTSETPNELAMSCVALKDYPNAAFSGFVKRLRPKNKDLVYPKYMAFYLRGPYFRKLVNSNTVMTLRASFNEHIFKFMNIYLPPYETQKQIGDLLYKIDQKIKINNEINDNLQQLITTIYDYYFSQFNFPDANNKPYKDSNNKLEWCEKLKMMIPYNWEVKSIINYFNIYQPETISNKEFNDSSEFKVYGGGGLIGRYNKYNHEDSEVIISCRGSCGNIYFTSPKSWITGNAMVVHPLTTYLSKYFIFEFLKRFGVEKYLTGSVQKQLTRENLSLMNICVPDNDTLTKYNNLVKPLFDKFIIIREENDNLINLRNELLPLLINGQVSID